MQSTLAEVWVVNILSTILTDTIETLKLISSIVLTSVITLHNIKSVA